MLLFFILYCFVLFFLDFFSSSYYVFCFCFFKKKKNEKNEKMKKKMVEGPNCIYFNLAGLPEFIRCLPESLIAQCDRVMDESSYDLSDVINYVTQG